MKKYNIPTAAFEVFDKPDDAKDYIREQLTNRVWESELRPEMPHQHYVDLTPKVAALRQEMYEKLHGGKI